MDRSDLPNRTPDYYTISVCEGPGVGSIQSITIDYYGNVYGGVGMALGKSGTFFTGSVIVGWLSTPERPKEDTLKGFCNGAANNVSAGALFGYGRTYSNGITGTEFGFFAPQIGTSHMDSTSIGSVKSFIDSLSGFIPGQDE
ncbi:MULTISPECIES: hypothetical protein [Pelosinus]|jgi:hypothetical protein|uniref:Uncharacterized protein n=1 Tax=Pelosinus fermentans B4 TaxID=1149862 RepID=I9LDC1_9FIRM|nr:MULTISPECIES: hypothetical protein [Pelosinus]EIW18311.1 hypothetical protein FB4_3485 [Pelosinus fermentans B4]EIW24297.1 hypothetical protein FA11_3486 [Pelosinus fermentans A11]OAM94257.1 YD repeat-containing protein [Pelosinus fermentans DSM 17108]SDR04367.1 hypothetical protein SAMN04515679_2378 [Pelosinus fermentans]